MPIGPVKTHSLYVNGEFVTAKSTKTLDVIEPANGETLGRVPDADADDVAAAVGAARAAFDEGPWKDATAQDRGRVLFELAVAVRTRAAELAELETRNTGKPIVEAEFDIADVATCFEYYGGLATKIHGDVIPVPDNAMSLALREPIGVAGQIIPWNYPLLMAAWKLAPAICAGCTMVLKPAEQTPLTVLELASSFADAGLPPGVINIVTGAGETGAAIVAHPGVDHDESTRALPFLAQKDAGQEDARVGHEKPSRLDQHLDVGPLQGAHQRLAVLARRGRLRTVPVGHPQPAAHVEAPDVVPVGAQREEQRPHLARCLGERRHRADLRADVAGHADAADPGKRGGQPVRPAGLGAGEVRPAAAGGGGGGGARRGVLPLDATADPGGAVHALTSRSPSDRHVGACHRGVR